MNLIPKLKLIPICFLLLLSVTGYAQRTHEGVVVEKKTGKAVPYASVRLLKENIAVSANEKGVFKLATKGDLITDTLIVTAVGYRSLKIRIGAFAGLDKENENFDYLQIAQKFELARAGAILKQVKLMRLVWHIAANDSNIWIPNTRIAPERTKFLIRVYDIDSLTGNPGRDLCDSLIEIKSNEWKNISANLSNFKIKIPGKSFFVAVQWLRLPYNECFLRLSTDTGNSFYTNGPRLAYKPAIGVSDLTGKNLNTYALNFKNEWNIYTHFVPDYTDFAISAQVEY